jgi:hypothetical protein
VIFFPLTGISSIELALPRRGSLGRHRLIGIIPLLGARKLHRGVRRRAWKLVVASVGEEGPRSH